MIVGLGDRADLGKLALVGADSDHRADARRAGTRQHAVEVFGEIGEIQMAVAVDEHQASPSLVLKIAPSPRTASEIKKDGLTFKS